MAKARAELAAAEQQEMELEVEREVVKATPKPRSDAAKSYLGAVASWGPTREAPAVALTSRVKESLTAIELVSNKSGNLKGTFQSALKKSVEVLREVFEELATRTPADEVARLQAENQMLKGQLNRLGEEMAELRAEVRSSKECAAPTTSGEYTKLREDLQAYLARMDARLESLEVDGRLLPPKRHRPPLAADRSQEAEAVPMSPTPAPRKAPAEKPATTAKAAERKAPAAPEAASTSGERRKKGNKTKKASPAAPAPTAPAQAAPAPASNSQTQDKEGWQTVGPRRRTKQRKDPADKAPRAKAPAKPAAPKPEAAKKAKAPKLHAPRSAAVVIALQRGAEERGRTYGEVIAEAKSKLDLGELGISSVRFRQAATGARILEVPGATSGGKADLLAEKLRGLFSTEDVKVSRPVTSVDLRVTGLDDSVTPEELAAAVAKAGGCSPGDVKPGEIRKGPGGVGTAIVKCPVTAAKKVVAERLRVGWVAVGVKILDALPRRCYRCFALGHIGAQCSSEIDRSQNCLCCGQAGHKARECSAKPHCPVCEAAGKKADHLAGGKACAKPPTKKAAKKAAARARKAKPQPENPPPGDTESPMEVH